MIIWTEFGDKYWKKIKGDLRIVHMVFEDDPFRNLHSQQVTNMTKWRLNIIVKIITLEIIITSTLLLISKADSLEKKSETLMFLLNAKIHKQSIYNIYTLGPFHLLHKDLVRMRICIICGASAGSPIVYTMFDNRNICENLTRWYACRIDTHNAEWIGAWL